VACRAGRGKKTPPFKMVLRIIIFTPFLYRNGAFPNIFTVFLYRKGIKIFKNTPFLYRNDASPDIFTMFLYKNGIKIFKNDPFLYMFLPFSYANNTVLTDRSPIKVLLPVESPKPAIY
jgi:hypothetical protein